MSVTLAPDHAGTLFSPGSYGVGDVAVRLDEWLAEIRDWLDATISLGASRREALRQLYEVLEDCGRSDWDGYGAKPVSFEAYERAKQFIAALPRELPVPEISADPDGDVSFEWYSAPSKVFSVSASPNNELNYAGLFGVSRTHGTEIFHDEIPQILLFHIKRVFS